MSICHLIFLIMFVIITSQRHIIDMTYTLGNDTIHLPGSKGFKLYSQMKGKNAAEIYVMANEFSTLEHMGTHVDAPIHFVPEGLTMAEVPIQNLIGEAIVVNISEKVGDNPDTFLETSDLKNWESVHGLIPKDCIVLVYTGWGKYWKNALKYYGDIETMEKLSCPGLSIDAATWLVNERKIKAVGVDTPSADNGKVKQRDVHRFLLGSNVSIFENVANLEKLPSKGFTVYAMPLPIENGSGAPMRMIGIISNNVKELKPTKCLLLIIIIILLYIHNVFV